MDRKTFLRLTAGSSLGFAGLAVGCGQGGGGAPDAEAEGSAAVGGTRTLAALGFQLYTIREIMRSDMRLALQEVSGAGYTEVEFAGYFDKTPQEVAALVREYGLSPVSAHVDIGLLRTDFDGVVAAASEVGHAFLIVPFLAAEERTSADDYRRLAQELNGLGERCRAHGINLGYHNHAFEFEVHGQSRGMDILLEETDPELVTFEFDLFWARAGGADAGEYMRAWPGRFGLCHVKDMDRAGAMVDVGAGIIDWAALFNDAETGGIQHFFVEHDEPTDPVATARNSAAYLSALTF